MAAAAPEAVALGEVLAAAMLLIAWAVCFGVLWAYRRSLKLVILGFANIIDVSVLGRHPLGHVAGWLRAQAKNIDHLLAEGVTASERGAVVLFKLFLNTQLWIASEIANLATDTWHAVRGVEHATVTKVTKVVTHTVVKPITTTVTIVKGTSAAVTKQLNAQAHALGARVTRLEHALGRTVASPFPRIGHLEREVANQAKRLKKAEKALAAGASAALVLTALKRLGIGWVRCGNVTKVGKRLCGLDPGLFEALLGATVLLTSGISLRDLARELEEPTKIARDGLRALIDEL
jgi:hypothetical protein